jgi:hypothetical protein
MMDIVELTARMGLDETDQSAVLAWTGRPVDYLWTETEADELADIWAADTTRIKLEGTR